MLPSLPLAVVASACITILSDLPAQTSRNVDLLGQIPIEGRVSDVWGHVDPATGKEYAIVGSYEGTWIVDCSDPANPTVTGTIPTEAPGASGNRWRDMKTYGNYCYSVSEAHGGMQIIDLTDPDNPVKVSTWGVGIWTNAHNIAMDRKNGIAYVCGTNSGTHVVDVQSNPSNPSYLGQYTATYVHDLAIQDGMAHMCDTGGNRYTIRDTDTTPSLPLISHTISAGSSSCHSVWPSRDNQIAALCHETSGGELVVYDISDSGSPTLKSLYQTGGSSAIIHNPMIVNRVCHIAWNTEGYQALDLSDPANPVRVGYYDTWSGSSSGFNGMWGVHAVMPSGLVFGSDRTAGLFVFKPKNTPRRYGAATPGTGTPMLHTFGATWVGNSHFRIQVEEAAPFRAGVIAIGTVEANTHLQGLSVLIDFAQPHVLAQVSTDAKGAASVALPLPGNLPTGVMTYWQAFILDASTPFGVSGSAAMETELFAL